MAPACLKRQIALEDPPVNSSADTSEVPAGAFGEWLQAFRASLKGNGGMDVPCGDCTGCCISGLSVQLRPEDRAAREHIPANLLVSAKGFSPGSLVMPPSPDGVCPMLAEGHCSIYPHRPQTCLDYDCRVFAAAGIEAGSPDKTVINSRVRSWRFDYADAADRNMHEAVRRAALFIREQRETFGGVPVPNSPSGIALLAGKTSNVFLAPLSDGAEPGPVERASAMLRAARDFDTQEITPEVSP